MFAHIPESKQSGAEAHAPIEIWRLKQPVERGTKIVNFRVAVGQPLRPQLGGQLRISLLRQDEEVSGMGTAHSRKLAAVVKALQGIFANCFQHRETWLGFGTIDVLDQILVHQGGQALEQIDPQIAARVADGFGSLERASANECGKAAEESAFG